MAHLHLLYIQIFNNDLIIIINQLGSKFLNNIMLDISNSPIITLQLGSRLNVIVCLRCLLPVYCSFPRQ